MDNEWRQQRTCLMCVWARTPQNVSQGLALSYAKRRVARGQRGGTAA